MSFHTNSSQQYSLTDITNSLTEREKKALENSWAKIFAEEIFPFIDEERLTLSRFRKRCYDYESVYGIDLLHGCVTDLNDKITKMMKIHPRIKCINSFMIEADIKNLSRAELLYACVTKLVEYIHKNRRGSLLDVLEHHYDSKDFKQNFYYSDSSRTEEQIRSILCDADKLLSLCGSDYYDTTEYQLFIRCLSEQTIIEDSERRLRHKENGGFGFNISKTD